MCPSSLPEMFGYVRVVEGDLREDVKSRYRAAYCGLCHTLGRRCGFLARFTLNYDFTLLAMLFAPPEPAWCEKRCPAHPLQKRRCCETCFGFDLAADESVILFRLKLADDVADSGFFSGLPARIAALTLEGAYRRAAAARPNFDARAREHLTRLRALEEAHCPSMDRAADAFACILRAAVPQGLTEHRGRALGELLYHLGRWIYLVDAWDDLAEDREKGNYNPLLVRFDGAPEEHLDELRTTLTHSARLCQAAFQLEDFGSWTPVLENILYLGLPGVQEEVLTGRWKAGHTRRGRIERGTTPRRLEKHR